MRSIPSLLLAAAITLVAASARAQDGAAGTVRVDAGAPANVLSITVEGPVAPPMADTLERLVRSAPQGRRTVLRLDSLGGQVEEGMRIAAFLEEERRRGRPVETVLDPGRRCGSICVAVYLAGSKRKASDASMMMFHGVTAVAPPAAGAQAPRHSPDQTDRLLAHFTKRGLSAAWLSEMRSAWGFERGGERWLPSGEVAAANPDAGIEIVPQRPPTAAPGR